MYSVWSGDRLLQVTSDKSEAIRNAEEATVDVEVFQDERCLPGDGVLLCAYTSCDGMRRQRGLRGDV